MSSNIDQWKEAIPRASLDPEIDDIGAHSGSLLSGILLISGTSIGAGMLALPVVTSHAGFLPSLLISSLCWLFMMATGLLFLEVTLWMKDGANVLSMAKRFLGKPGVIFAGISFVFLYYCLMIAYLSGVSPLFGLALETIFGTSVHPVFSYWMFGFALMTIVAFGAKMIDRSNFVFMIGLIIAYILLLGIGVKEVHAYHLQRTDWTMTLFAAPILFSAFGFHNVIPSISTYLGRNKKKLRLSIIIGTMIPFIVYVLWQWLIIGTLPQNVIEEIESQGTPIGSALEQVTKNLWFSTLTNYFAFFAIITSILGVSLSMVDFIGDGLGTKRTGISRLWLSFLVFLPPMLLGVNHPALFVTALGIAGGFGEALLNGLLPISLVWMGRYHFHLPGEKMLFGGKAMLVLITMFTFLIMGVEMYHLTHPYFSKSIENHVPQ